MALDHILESLEPTLGPVGHGPVPLEGGITNRNFRVSMGEHEYVLRLHGKDTELLGISREAERIANDAAAKLGIAPEVAASFAGGIVTRFQSCSPLDEDAIGERVVEIGRLLHSFHESGAELPTVFWVPELLERYAALVRERGVELPAEYVQAQELANRIGDALPLRDARPCHNDLLAGNLIAASENGRTMVVDWEYAGMGLPSFDLGNLSVNNDFGDEQDGELLRAYLDAAPTSAQMAALKLSKVLSDAREGAWGVMQGELSELDFDFRGYAEEHFARMGEVAARPEFQGWLEAVGA